MESPFAALPRAVEGTPAADASAGWGVTSAETGGRSRGHVVPSAMDVSCHRVGAFRKARFTWARRSTAPIRT